jgi:hypothetical protein
MMILIDVLSRSAFLGYHADSSCLDGGLEFIFDDLRERGIDEWK